ncbi:hypothetical protein [Actinomadura sp. 7K534]|uniref:hypothetical protein n=1 Tax=Actinomadura sp. 7K534 TaxID=2530366 RepID=UPI0010478A12|nr:hypothetical protein [Actinomadura sp. 7K534]TDB95483.1 hypothetical protein E1266_13170 [Actinomadura sp. 7K534]
MKRIPRFPATSPRPLHEADRATAQYGSPSTSSRPPTATLCFVLPEFADEMYSGRPVRTAEFLASPVRPVPDLQAGARVPVHAAMEFVGVDRS